jgi:hypothetical protein
MSIKILLISSDEELFHQIENVFQNHIERGFFIIYSPQNVENSPVKIVYDLIITEEKYLSLIPLKHIPIIVLNSTGGEKNPEPNLIYTENPVKLEDLYDIILSLQYRFSSTNVVVDKPIVKNYTPMDDNINLNKLNEVDTYTFDSDTINVNTHNIDTHNVNMENNTPINIINNNPTIDIKKDKEPIFNENVINKNVFNESININFDNFHEEVFSTPANSNSFNNYNNNIKQNSNKENHELISKFYNSEDLKKITKILYNYGEENQVNDKVIAQASIILDELLYTINNLENFDNKNNKEPKILMTIKNYNEEFQMNIECLVPLEDKIQNIISIAQDYGNIIQSFKRNNNYYLNVNWYL